jgi:CRISPR-associated protein Cas2
MLELAPGVYSAPRITPAIRSRIWNVLEEWFAEEEDASIVMLWADNSIPGGQSVRTLGAPPIELVEVDGLVLSKK